MYSDTKYRTFVVKGKNWVPVACNFFYEGPDREEALRRFEAATRDPSWRKSTSYMVCCCEMGYIEDRDRWTWKRDAGLDLKREL